jgi:hypothetical protein
MSIVDFFMVLAAWIIIALPLVFAMDRVEAREE